MNKFKIISFLILTSFSSFSFGGAAEQWNASPRQMTIADMGMRTRNGIGVGNVKAANGMINADITQRVTVDGSNATINTKVSIPANDDTFARKTASHAKNLLKGGAYGAGAAAAMKVILDGVDYVLDPKNNTIQKPNPEYTQPTKVEPWHQYRYFVTDTNQYVASTSALQKIVDARYTSSTWTNCKVGFDNLVRCDVKNDYSGSTANMVAGYREANPFYNSSVQNPTQPRVIASDGDVNDAFYKWMKDNPNSITDPIKTYIYSPKDSQGNALPKTPEGSDPSFGPNEITDEMMNNYMEHRNANLQNPYTTTIGDSAQTDTTQNPDGTKTSTKTNPDGSKTTTRTDTKTDPDSGEVTTTVTETTTNPDGSTSTKTETSTQTKPKPETTDLPAFCDYAATLCTWIKKDTDHKADEKSLWEKITDWFDWTKENPDMPEENPLVPQELDIGSLNTGTFQATAGCPADIQAPVSFGGASKSIAISYEPICALAQKWSFIAPLIGFISGAMILIGVGRKGEDGDS